MDYLQYHVIPLLRRIQGIPGAQCPGDAGGVRAQGPWGCPQVKASAWHTGSARAQGRAQSRLKLEGLGRQGGGDHVWCVAGPTLGQVQLAGSVPFSSAWDLAEHLEDHP